MTAMIAKAAATISTVSVGIPESGCGATVGDVGGDVVIEGVVVVIGDVLVGEEVGCADCELTVI